MSPQEFAGRLTAEGFRVRLNEPLDSCIQRKSDAVVLDFVKAGEEQDERGDERTHGRPHTDQETHPEDRQNNAPSGERTRYRGQNQRGSRAASRSISQNQAPNSRKRGGSNRVRARALLELE